MREQLDGPADIVLSDMAAPATGRRAVDRLRAEGLGESVLEFAGEALVTGGACVVKLIKGSEAALMPRAMALFATARSRAAEGHSRRVLGSLSARAGTARQRTGAGVSGPAHGHRRWTLPLRDWVLKISCRSSSAAAAQ